MGVRRTIVLYQFGNDQWLAELQRMGHSAFQYPIEPSQLAFEIGRSQVEKETSQGVGNLSELMPAKPRMFNDAELRAAAEETSAASATAGRGGGEKGELRMRTRWPLRLAQSAYET